MGKLLVIGNGFDLSIGAKTAYRNYFESNYYSDTIVKVDKWIEAGKSAIEEIETLNNFNMQDNDFSCWDLLFCLESKDNNSLADNVQWCDVESVIHESLISESNNSFSWGHVYSLLHNNYYQKEKRIIDPQNPKITFEQANTKIQLMYLFLLSLNWKEYSIDKDFFYRKLLEELKEFEHSFGRYINMLTDNNSFFYDAETFAQRLTNNNGRIHIDSFNYSDFSNERLVIRHINGDDEDPIFGIDFNKEEEQKYPYARRFTKTSRRVNQDSHNLNRDTNWDTLSIDKVTVFGHSLNPMDYDYYIYLFTMLKFNTMDVDKMGSLEFVYKVYDTNKENEIRNHFSDSVYALVNYYEEFISNSNQHVLLNLLRFSGKLILREI